MEDVKLQIKEFLGTFFNTHDLKEDEDIFASGYVNSLFVMQLILFLEKQFGVVVLDEDLEIENFNTLNALALYVEHKTSTLSGL